MDACSWSQCERALTGNPDSCVQYLFPLSRTLHCNNAMTRLALKVHLADLTYIYLTLLERLGVKQVVCRPVLLNPKRKGGRRRVRRGGFPLPGNPPNVPNEQRFWAFFGRAHDRSGKNAKLQKIVTQSNLAQIQRSIYPGRIENSQLLVGTIICEALRAMYREINHSLIGRHHTMVQSAASFSHRRCTLPL